MINFYDSFFKMVRFVFVVLFGKQPPARVIHGLNDNLPDAGSTRGTLIIGDPGTGKTRYAAMQIFRKFKEFLGKQAIIIFDWSGSLTNSVLDLISRDPDYEKLLDHTVLDELGNEEWIIPKPEFSPEYGLSVEDQVNRVTDNMQRLAEFLVKGAPFLAGVSIEETGKELFRLLTAITNESGDSFQITEAKRLLMDLPLLKNATLRFGYKQPSAKWYFEHEYLPKNVMNQSEKELTTRALRYLLSKIEGREARATLGSGRPGISTKKVTQNGLLHIIDAHKMINEPAAQHYLLMQNFSHVMSWINKREVDDPTNNPVMIAFDETYTILKIPGMAAWLGMVAPLYRSRNFQLLVIIQALWQLDENLARQIWSLGNVASFAVSNNDEASQIARQLFAYDPKYVKHTPKTQYQNATTESSEGQDRIIADWIQNLKAREVIMRRYITEQRKENGVVHIPKTSDFPNNPPFVSIKDIKQALYRIHGVRVDDALKEINKRTLGNSAQKASEVPHL